MLGDKCVTHPGCGMEDLALRWKKLSLSKAKGKKHDLTKEKKISEYVIAAKFFTDRKSVV